MGTLYIDEAPDVQPHNGHALFTFTSGGEKVRLILTRHAAHHLLRRANLTVDCLFDGGDGGDVVPLPKRGRR